MCKMKENSTDAPVLVSVGAPSAGFTGTGSTFDPVQQFPLRRRGSRLSGHTHWRRIGKESIYDHPIRDHRKDMEWVMKRGAEAQFAQDEEAASSYRASLEDLKVELLLAVTVLQVVDHENAKGIVDYVINRNQPKGDEK